MSEPHGGAIGASVEISEVKEVYKLPLRESGGELGRGKCQFEERSRFHFYV